MGLISRIGGVLTSIPPPAARQNWLDNGNFIINQRAYASGTTLTIPSGSPDGYGLDRWKILNGNAGSMTLTALPNGSVSVVTSGNWNQVIPGYRVTSTTAIISWLGSNNFITVGATSYSGTLITIGADSRRYAYVTGLTIGNNLTVVLASGGTFSEVMLEAVPAVGYPVGPYQRVRYSVELQECERYYQTSYPIGNAPGAKVASAYLGYATSSASVAVTAGVGIVMPFQPAMRAAPTLALYSPGTGVKGNAYDNVNAVDVTPTILSAASAVGAAISAASSKVGACNISVHFTATADF